uniref:Voltage-gated hydrogen channel 1 n=1 Tax=Iconisemion striatum TaxID=60296 RepID=A0A1A7YD50_9TELE
MARYLRHFSTVGDRHVAHLVDEEHEDVVDRVPAIGQNQNRTPLSFRDQLKKLYSSDRFQVVVVCLVILDAFFVLAELLIDLAVIKLEHGHVAPRVRWCPTQRNLCDVASVFHYLSLALLTFFMVELAGKIFAFRLEFLHHKFEVFDGLVVVISFVLDIVFIFHEDAFNGINLLILLRLWRVARLLNGIVVSVKTRADHKLHKLKERNDHLVERTTELQRQNDELVKQNQNLLTLLRKHNIDVSG